MREPVAFAERKIVQRDARIRDAVGFDRDLGDGRTLIGGSDLRRSFGCRTGGLPIDRKAEKEHTDECDDEPVHVIFMSFGPVQY